MTSRAGWTAFAALALGLPAVARGQDLVFHHSFPLAGDRLQIVLEGAPPLARVQITLADAEAAPPSVFEWIVRHAKVALPDAELTSALTSHWLSDAAGRVTWSIPLEAEDDAQKTLALRARVGGDDALLRLFVVPPMLVLQTRRGLERLDLRSGALLPPTNTAAGGLLGLALSPDGEHGYLLRQGGRLEVLSSARFEGPPLSTLELPVASADLAGSPLVGPAFVLERPAGDPYTPAGRVLFLDGDSEPLVLEPMGQQVSGRRWALAPDGLSAFVAEDDLVVREIDLVSATARALFAVGSVGDDGIADLLLDGRALLVATRGRLGRPGSLTVFDLDTGLLRITPLAFDPLRLAALGAEADAEASAARGALVVPAAGAIFQVFGPDGVLRTEVAGSDVLDAIGAPGGATLLLGTGLARWTAATGTSPLATNPAPPQARRLVGGSELAVLLGEPRGGVWVVDLVSGEARAVPGLVVDPDAPFARLP